MKLLVASRNPKKLAELRRVLDGAGVALTLLSLDDVAPFDDAPETGATFEENALAKARDAFRASGLPSVADDSGLEVDALHGEPGIRSARYAGEGASDAQNLQKLLDELRARPGASRVARYRCALVFMRWAEDPAPLICQASWDGRIIDTPRGSGGFGYDPIFELPERGVTTAELPAEEKNRLSHRGRALQELVLQLRSQLRPDG